jgi:hypothetical protein
MKRCFRAGSLRTTAASLLSIGVLVTLLSACGRDPTSSAAAATGQDGAAQQAPPTNRIDIPPMVRSNLGITFARVERRRVAGTVRIPGAFELEPRARREYRMMLAGSVELLVDQYQPVSAGDVLYRVRSPQWTELQQAIAGAAQAMLSAEAEAELARARVAEARSRLKILRARLDTLSAAEFRRADLEAEAAILEGTISTLLAEVRVAESSVAMAERSRDAALARASAAINVPPESLASTRNALRVPTYQTIDSIEVVALEDGIVSQLALSDGAFAEPTTFILSTIDPTRVRFRATALQSDLSRLGVLEPGGTSAVIVPPRGSGSTAGEPVGATMMLGLEANPDQRTITVLARPSEARPWIRPGISAYLEIELDATSGPALAIRRSAVVQDGLTHVFFRRDPGDPNKAIRVEADMGPSDGEWVVIKSGLMLSDEVVLDGVYELKLATDRSGTNQRGGHFHADGTWHPEH